MSQQTAVDHSAETGNGLRFTREKINDAWQNPDPNTYYVIATQGFPKFSNGTEENPGKPFNDYDEELAPSWGLFHKYDSLSNEQWDREFKAQVGREFIVERSLYHAEQANGQTVCFCCYEDNGDHCHIYNILDILAEELPEAEVTTREDHGVQYKTDGGRQTGLTDWGC